MPTQPRPENVLPALTPEVIAELQRDQHEYQECTSSGLILGRSVTEILIENGQREAIHDAVRFADPRQIGY